MPCHVPSGLVLVRVVVPLHQRSTPAHRSPVLGTGLPSGANPSRPGSTSTTSSSTGICQEEQEPRSRKRVPKAAPGSPPANRVDPPEHALVALDSAPRRPRGRDRKQPARADGRPPEPLPGELRRQPDLGVVAPERLLNRHDLRLDLDTSRMRVSGWNASRSIDPPSPNVEYVTSAAVSQPSASSSAATAATTPACPSSRTRSTSVPRQRTCTTSSRPSRGRLPAPHQGRSSRARPSPAGRRAAGSPRPARPRPPGAARGDGG